MTDATPATPNGSTPPGGPPPGKRNLFTRFLDGVEWLGNCLPHPVTLFFLLAVGIVLLSGLFGSMGVAGVASVISRPCSVESGRA